MNNPCQPALSYMILFCCWFYSPYGWGSKLWGVECHKKNSGYTTVTIYACHQWWLWNRWQGSIFPWAVTTHAAWPQWSNHGQDDGNVSRRSWVGSDRAIASFRVLVVRETHLLWTNPAVACEYGIVLRLHRFDYNTWTANLLATQKTWSKKTRTTTITWSNSWLLVISINQLPSTSASTSTTIT